MPALHSLCLRTLSVGLSLFGKEKTVDLWTQSLLAWRELGDDEEEIKELFTRHVSPHSNVSRCKFKGW